MVDAFLIGVAPEYDSGAEEEAPTAATAMKEW